MNSKYHRKLPPKVAEIDVYRVCRAFGVTDQELGHAVKKILMPGQRGAKDRHQDLREAIQAIECSIEMDLEDAEAAESQPLSFVFTDPLRGAQ